MKIRIGIVGYGNLGKAVEREVLKNKDYKLVAIFSRRTINSIYSTPVESYSNIGQYHKKIDLMMLCGGSKNDIIEQLPSIADSFDTINCFDTHAKLLSLKTETDKLCKNNKTRAIIACGWDPGLFSVFRAISLAITHSEPITFWGKGISMGHSDALRQIDGVVDGIEYTIPNPKAVKLAKLGQFDTEINKHFRSCYVVTNKNNTNVIESQIKSIPNYFLGEETTVNYVSPEKLISLKKNMAHKGKIFASKQENGKTVSKLYFYAEMKSNPDFTASIMCAYINAIINLKDAGICGAFTPLDIPAIYLFDKKYWDYALSKFC